MKRVVVISVLMVLFSCGGENKHGETLEKDTSTIATIDTIQAELKDTVKAVEQAIVLNDIPKAKDVKERLIYFRDKYLVNYDEIQPEELKVYVLDRFTSDKKYKVILKKKFFVKYGEVDSIYPIAGVRAYVYKDSAQAANAMYNWFNCFGNDCSMIKAGEPVTIKSTPGFYIINKQSIITLDYPLEHQSNNWNQMIAHLKTLFADKQSLIIKVEPHGKLMWVK